MTRSMNKFEQHNCCVTVQELEDKVRIPTSLVDSILSKDFGLPKKFCEMYAEADNDKLEATLYGSLVRIC